MKEEGERKKIVLTGKKFDIDVATWEVDVTWKQKGPPGLLPAGADGVGVPRHRRREGQTEKLEKIAGKITGRQDLWFKGPLDADGAKEKMDSFYRAQKDYRCLCAECAEKWDEKRRLLCCFARCCALLVKHCT